MWEEIRLSEEYCISLILRNISANSLILNVQDYSMEKVFRDELLLDKENCTTLIVGPVSVNPLIPIDILEQDHLRTRVLS